MTDEITKKEPNYAIPVVILALLIICGTVYFGKFWYKALKSNPKKAEVSEVQSAKDTKVPEESPKISKTEKPVVDLFVMSFCPYGNLAENTMAPVIDLLKDKVEWNLHYVVSVEGNKISSLHGQPEVDQNVRELCVQDLYGSDKMWDFLLYVNEKCGSDGSCWKDGASSLALSSTSIETCVKEKSLEFMSFEAKKSTEYGAQGSPTMYINGTQDNSIYKYGNPNTYKEAICSAFLESPEECSTELAATSANASGSCN